MRLVFAGTPAPAVPALRAAERLPDLGALPDMLRAAAGRKIATLIDIDEGIAEGR